MSITCAIYNWQHPKKAAITWQNVYDPVLLPLLVKHIFMTHFSKSWQLNWRNIFPFTICFPGIQLSAHYWISVGMRPWLQVLLKTLLMQINKRMSVTSFSFVLFFSEKCTNLDIIILFFLVEFSSLTALKHCKSCMVIYQHTACTHSSLLQIISLISDHICLMLNFCDRSSFR